jgi:hypothetical protein
MPAVALMLGAVGVPFSAAKVEERQLAWSASLVGTEGRTSCPLTPDDRERASSALLGVAASGASGREFPLTAGRTSWDKQ